MCIMFSILSWRISVEIDCRRDRSRQCQDIRRLSPFVNFIHSSGNCCVRCLLRTLLILICAYKCVKSCCHIRFRDNGSYICVKIQQRGRYRASPVANFARAFGCLKSASLITAMGTDKQSRLHRMADDIFRRCGRSESERQNTACKQVLIQKVS